MCRQSAFDVPRGCNQTRQTDGNQINVRMCAKLQERERSLPHKQMRSLTHRGGAVDVGRRNGGRTVRRARPDVATVVHAGHLHQSVHGLLDAVPVQLELLRAVIVEPKVCTLGNCLRLCAELGTDAGSTAKKKSLQLPSPVLCWKPGSLT